MSKEIITRALSMFTADDLRYGGATVKPPTMKEVAEALLRHPHRERLKQELIIAEHMPMRSWVDIREIVRKYAHSLLVP